MADSSVLPFDLFIQALPTGSYRITATNAPSGPASIEIPAPFSFSDLAQLSDVIDGRAGLSAADQTARIQAFGTALFQTVISGQVADTYTKSQNSAGSAGLNLRLELDQAGLLRGLPWQLMRDPNGGKLIVTVPKAANNITSVGGAREVFFRPGVILPILLIVVILIVVGVGVAATVFARSDVDLVVAQLRLFPSNPSPGQVTTVALTIKNTGTTDAGPFNWYWYEDKNSQSQGLPQDKQGTVPGLPAGTSITVKDSVIFGWWGLYSTEAWVNPDQRVKETSYSNNFNTGNVTTSNNPFTIDWSTMPDSSVITQDQDLKGNEFKDWGLGISPQVTNLTSPDPQCSKAIAKISVSTDVNANQINRLITGLASGSGQTATPTTCDSLPLTFTVSHAIGSAAVDFTSPRGGNYVLTVLDQDGGLLGTVNATVNADEETILTVQGKNKTLLTKTAGVQIQFSENGTTGGTQINSMVLTKNS